MALSNEGGGRLDTGHALSFCFVEILDFSVLALLSAHTEEFRVPRYQQYLCEFPICKISNKMVFPQCSSGSPDRGIRRDHTMHLSALSVQYSTALCNGLQCTIVWLVILQCSVAQHITEECNAMKCIIVECSVVLYCTVQYNDVLCITVSNQSLQRVSAVGGWIYPEYSVAWLIDS